MRNNRETDKNKSGRYKVKSRHYKWAFTYNKKSFFKKILPISQVCTTQVTQAL